MVCSFANYGLSGTWAPSSFTPGAAQDKCVAAGA